MVEEEELTEFTIPTEEMVLNMGPQHPSTHGVIRFILRTDGEVIALAKPDIGFLHRAMEKIAERVTYPQFMPYTDRIDYLGSMNCNWGWALACERLMGVEVPRRAEVLRVIMAELNRIISHMISVGSHALDMGAVTPFVHFIREREYVNDLIEVVCGARLTYNYMRIGGVGYDLTDGWEEKLESWLDHYEPIVDEENRLISYNKIFIERLANVGVVSRDDAIGYALAGPNLRASGVKWDLRRDDPYGVYPELDFDVVIGTGSAGTVGDSYDRFMVRIWEMLESIKIVRQALKMLEPGPIMAEKVPKKPPEGELFCRTEAPRGELGFYLISDGSNKPYRARIRTGSFTAMSIIEHMSPGLMLADLVAVIGSLDVVAPEIDR